MGPGKGGKCYQTYFLKICEGNLVRVRFPPRTPAMNLLSSPQAVGMKSSWVSIHSAGNHASPFQYLPLINAPFSF